MITLRDYQQETLASLVGPEATAADLVVCATGGGKTVIFAELLNRVLAPGRRGLVLAHRDELIDQAVDKIRWVAPDLAIEREKAEARAARVPGLFGTARGVVVASVQTLRGKRLEEWPRDAFDIIICDECFPAGTMVDGRPIETLQIGDKVTAFSEATGTFALKPITRLFKNRPKAMVRVSTSAGSIICTAGHPFWTERGWIQAARLRHTDAVLTHHATADLHMVPSGHPQAEQAATGHLESIEASLLLGPMRSIVPLAHLIPDHDQDEYQVRFITNESEQSDASWRLARVDGCDVTSDEAWSPKTWWEWDWAQPLRTALGLGNGPTPVVDHDEYPAGNRPADALQDRFGRSDAQTRGGDRWAQSCQPHPASAGSKEGSLSHWVRVDGVEVLEPGSDGRFGGLCPDGFVYNIEVEGLHTYVADGFVVHNCHHATAASYVAIFERFHARLVGVTATPSRTDGKPLGDVFSRIAVDFGIRHLVQRGWLVPVAARVVRSDTDLSDVKQSAGDYAIGELQNAVNTDGRNHLIIAAMQRWGEGRQTIVYCAGVDHARELAALMTVAGMPAEAVWGEMPMEDRKAVLERFRRGEVRALTNFGVLTEGFDEPKVGCIVLARPTQSVLLLTQMVGRGTRPLEEIAGTLDATDPLVRREAIAASGKPNVLVIDIQDVSHRMQATAATLAGLPGKFDAKGGDIFRAADELEKIDPRLAARCLDADKLRDLIAQVAAGLSVSEIDVLAATSLDPAVAAYSRFVWASTAPDTYAIRIGTDTLALAPNTLGQYTFSRMGRAPGGAWAMLKDHLPTIGEAFALADAFIAANYPEKIGLIDAEAKWRLDGPSDKQIEWLLKKGVFPSRTEVPASLTKGQASQLLDETFAKRGRR